MTQMTPQQAEALGRFLVAVRPDWRLVETMDAVARMRLIETDLERVTRAAIRCALTATVVRPDVLAMNGQHWKAQADFHPEPPTGTPRCESCRGIHTPTSPCDERPSERPDDWLVQLRREIRKTKRYGAETS